MARPLKSGLDYFGIETDIETDPKIKKLIRYGGGTAWTIYSWTLICAYRQSYYSTVDDVIDLITWNFRDISEETIVNTLSKMADIGLIDKSLFNENVITSKGIQKRCLPVFRKRSGIDCRYWLLDEYPPQKFNNIGVSEAETTVSDAEIPHRTEQKRTVIVEQSKSRENEKSDSEFLQNSFSSETLGNIPNDSEKIPYSKAEESRVKESKVKQKKSEQRNDAESSDDLQSSFSGELIELLKEAGVDIKRNTLQKISEWLGWYDPRSIEEAVEDAINKHGTGQVKSIVGYASSVLDGWANGKGSPKWVEDREREIAEEKAEHLQPSKISTQILKRI